jgi:hypothetical protein
MEIYVRIYVATLYSENVGKRRLAMRLLTKWVGSDTNDCPSVYVTDDPELLVIQGNILDETMRGELVNKLAGEDAVAIPTETILRAADLIREQS